MRSRPPDVRQSGPIAAAIACVAIVGIGISLTIPLLSLEMDRMGISRSLIGANTAVAGVASILAVPFVPALAMRFKVLPVLWACVAVVTMSLIAFKVFHGLAWWFAIRFVFSAAIGVLFVLSEFWINTAAPPARRGFVMGVYATVLALGLAAGPLVLAATGASGWPPYLAGAVLFALAAVPLLFVGNVSPVVERGTGRTVLSLLAAAPAATFAALVFGALETAAYALLPVYGLAIGLTVERAALLVSAVALGNVACQIPLGLLSDRVDRRAILLGVGVSGALGAAILPALTGSFAWLSATLFLWGGLTGALYTVGLAHLGARFTGRDLVSANAAFVLLYNVGLVLGPPVAGVAMDLVPPQGFAAALAGFCILYVAVVGGRILRHPGKS
jgi:MFS family permease